MSETVQSPEKAQNGTVSVTSPTQPVSKSLPPSFPQKRRGRPPGRPNKTSKESDYADNANVQRWNAAKVDIAIPAVAINIAQALPLSFLTRDPQREIHRLPSREYIYFVQGWITPRQIASQRASYVNGLLIHSRGEDSVMSCDQCAEKRSKNALGPFLTCRVLKGMFHGSCSNCKWFDTTAACSLYTGPKPNRKRKAKDGDEDGAVQREGRNGAAGTPLSDQANTVVMTGISAGVDGVDSPASSRERGDGNVVLESMRDVDSHGVISPEIDPQLTDSIRAMGEKGPNAADDLD